MEERAYSPRALVDTFELPAKVRVVKGWFGRSDDESLAEGDAFTVYFSKREKLVKARDRRDREVSIPLYTTYQFCVLHEAFGRAPYLSSDGVSKQKSVVATTLSDRQYSLTEILQELPLPVTVRVLDSGEGFVFLTSRPLVAPGSTSPHP